MHLLTRVSLFLFVFAGACRPTALNSRPIKTDRTQENPSGKPSADYHRVAQDRLGDGASYDLNQSRTMVLCQKEQPAAAPAMLNTVRFLVILLKDNSILYEDQLVNVRVEWFNNTQLKIFNYAGTVQVIPGRQQPYYFIDVVTKQKVLVPDGKI
jgi:hypothetical protein